MSELTEKSLIDEVRVRFWGRDSGTDGILGTPYLTPHVLAEDLGTPYLTPHVLGPPPKGDEGQQE